MAIPPPTVDTPLDEREQRFVVEYLIDFCAGRAYERAGFMARGNAAEACAYKLLRRPHIAAAIAAANRKIVAKTELTAERVLEEIRRLAFSDIRALFDEHGNLKPLHTLTADESACIASVEVIIKNAAAGDGVTDTVHKIKAWDKTKSLELLAKHFKLLVNVLEGPGGGPIRVRWEQ